MVHLTNDYRKLLRKNGPKAALSLCVALALSGGLVSAEGKTYDYVNQWGVREALEGDPIEVKWMRGGEGTLKAGTDETGEVIVHSLATGGNPDVYVKGKKITIGDNYPSSNPKEGPVMTANWGGNISIGGDTTESVTMEGLHAGNQSKTTIYGRTISMGTLGTGDGQFTIGNKNTESVTINDFGAAEGSSTTINGRIVSMGSLNNYKGKVTVNADENFKVVKDTGLQHIGVVGGQLTVYADSMEAKSLSAAGGNSMADIHISGEKGVHFLNGLSATEGDGVGGGTVQIESPVITIDAADGYNGIVASNHSTVNLRGKDLFVNGGLNITTSSLTAEENGILQLGDENNHARFVITGSQVSLGNEKTKTNLYGGILNAEFTDYITYEVTPSSIDIHGKEIMINGVNNKYAYDSILTHGSGEVTVGDADSDVWLKGRLFNTGSEVMVNGRTIYIIAPKVVDIDLDDSDSNVNSAIRTTGDNTSITRIGDEHTDKVHIDGRIDATNMSSLLIHGRNIFISNAKSTALRAAGHEWRNPTKGTILSAGGEETESLTINGQVANTNAAELKLSGQHITVDSTEYDGSENSGQYPQAVLAFSNDIDAGTEHTKTININGGLDAMGGSIHVLGKEITVNASDYFKTHTVKVRDWKTDKYIILLCRDRCQVEISTNFFHLPSNMLLY